MVPAYHSFAQALVAQGPAADRGAQMGLYAWLIGDWTFDAVLHNEDGGTATGQGEIHFSWVLEGRAIQDVWILPGSFHGTTLRIYDPGLDAWHILWSDPLKQLYARQLGRARGKDIVQDGVGDSAHMRWSFTEITPDSFHWIGEHSKDAGKSWRYQVEFFARRVRS